MSDPGAVKCARCGTLGSTDNPLGEHHIYPSKWRVQGHFADVDKDERNRTVTLCFRDCHRSLHRLLDQYEGGKPLYWLTYRRICDDFCRWLTPAA